MPVAAGIQTAAGGSRTTSAGALGFAGLGTLWSRKFDPSFAERGSNCERRYGVCSRASCGAGLRRMVGALDGACHFNA
jgi:hypothetical protein